jgi:Zn finger protein HypA/HybF involved in hydrogenase expression
MKEKMQEKDPLDPQTVFKITRAEISQTAVTQCEMGKHRFQKLSENEVFCPVCQSAYIVNNIKDYLNA